MCKYAWFLIEINYDVFSTAQACLDIQPNRACKADPQTKGEKTHSIPKKMHENLPFPFAASQTANGEAKSRSKTSSRKIRPRTHESPSSFPSKGFLRPRLRLGDSHSLHGKRGRGFCKDQLFSTLLSFAQRALVAG